MTESENLKLEKFKQVADLVKWFFGSVVLVVVTTIIDAGFKDRAAGLNEIKEYDKYATELLILNNDPVKKRMLAQFFSKVTPSEKLRKGWENYYKEVEIEYQLFKLSDSLKRHQLDSLGKSKSKNPENMQIAEKINELKNEIKENDKIFSQPLILPNTVVPVVYIQIVNESRKNFAEKLNEEILSLGYKAPGIELVTNVELSSNEVRYFRPTDESYAKSVQNLLSTKGVDSKLILIEKYASSTKDGVIEVWLK